MVLHFNFSIRSLYTKKNISHTRKQIIFYHLPHNFLLSSFLITLTYEKSFSSVNIPAPVVAVAGAFKKMYFCLEITF